MCCFWQKTTFEIDANRPQREVILRQDDAMPTCSFQGVSFGLRLGG